MQSDTTLENYLGFELGASEDSADLRTTIGALAIAASSLTQKVAQGSLIDMQDSIELVAFSLFEEQVRELPIGLLLSEGFETPRLQNPDSGLALIIYPLEGRTNIEAAMPFGSLFSIYRLASPASDQELSAATMIAAGFFVYAAQTLLVLSCGQGTAIFTLNTATAEFMLSREHVNIPQKRREITIDTSNYRFWDSGVRHFVDDCISGSNGPLGVDYEMGWRHSLVVEAYRVISGGGVYIFPDDTRPGFENGKHKLLYEAAPVAFLIEQAGGKSSDGYESIGSRSISKIDSCVPFIFGARDGVDQVLEYYGNDPTETTRFPLFESRSLLRN